MLSGIKTGKKKKRKVTESAANAPKAQTYHDNESTNSTNKKPRPSSDSNLSVAQQLKQQLSAGVVPTSRNNNNGGLEARLSRATTAAGAPSINDDKNVVVLTGAAAATTSDRPDYQPEDFRHGSKKGKLKRPQPVDVAGTSQQEASLSIQEMIAQEHSQTRSMDEVFARNVARIGSRYKGSDFVKGSATGADEDDNYVDINMFSSQDSKLTNVAMQQKERSRQLARHDLETSLTKKFWWWLESPSFQRHTLLALGNHVSMVMTPPRLSLVPGTQVYLVPIKHAESLVNCEDDVWNEIARFQSALRTMYAKQDKDVMFVETVLPNKGLWQTRLQAVPIPKRAAQDAPLNFKAALTEQAEEWGTHTKLLAIRDKGLRGTIPNKFPYFFVEWAMGEGFAQIIESSSFSADFGIDTIAGMMQMDPLKFRARQETSSESERQLILDFIEKWKPFDWTRELDA